jgi:calpain-15
VKGEKVQWKRPEQFIDNPDLFPEEITPNDVYQGWLNDCYYLSAVSCLAEKPHRIYSIFESKEYNPNGYYICKLTFNGVYQEVIVDDLFPVIDNATPVYAKPASAKYIWVMVL